MGFRYVEDVKRINETLDFIETQAKRKNEFSKWHKVFTSTPKDTRIKFIPSYLLKDGENLDEERIVYAIDKTMPSSLTIS